MRRRGQILSQPDVAVSRYQCLFQVHIGRNKDRGGRIVRPENPLFVDCLLIVFRDKLG